MIGMYLMGFHVPTSMVQEFLEIVELNGFVAEILPSNNACVSILMMVPENKITLQPNPEEISFPGTSQSDSDDDPDGEPDPEKN